MASFCSRLYRKHVSIRCGSYSHKANSLVERKEREKKKGKQIIIIQHFKREIRGRKKGIMRAENMVNWSNQDIEESFLEAVDSGSTWNSFWDTVDIQMYVE